MRHSQRSRFNNCPYAYSLEQQGLRKAEEGAESNDRSWGAAMHGALQFHYDKKPLDACVEEFERLYPEDMDPSNLAKTKENGRGILKLYTEYCVEMDKEWEVLGTEVEDDVEIENETGQLGHQLHIDLVARHRQSGSVYFWDHKFTEKALGRSFWHKYELDAQMTRYTEYIIQKYGSCGGCIVNAISARFLKRKNKYEEGPGLVVDMDRHIFNRTPDQIEFWKESERDWMRMMEFSKKESCYPRLLGTLCSWCEYWDLCIASADESVKEILYEIRSKT